MRSIFIYFVKSDQEKKVLKEQTWYDSLYQKMYHFQCTHLKYKPVDEYYVVTSFDKKISVEDMCKELLRKNIVTEKNEALKLIKKNYKIFHHKRMIAEPVVEVKKEKKIDKNKTFDILRRFFDFNKLEFDVIEERKWGCEISMDCSDDLFEDFIDFLYQYKIQSIERQYGT